MQALAPAKAAACQRRLALGLLQLRLLLLQLPLVSLLLSLLLRLLSLLLCTGAAAPVLHFNIEQGPRGLPPRRQQVCLASGQVDAGGGRPGLRLDHLHTREGW